jgi:hypothetical protein
MAHHVFSFQLEIFIVLIFLLFAESVMILHSELKRQRNLVKKLKKKSLWSRPLEDVITFIHIFFITLYPGFMEYFLLGYAW